MIILCIHWRVKNIREFGRNYTHIRKALLDFDIWDFFESANGLKFKNWCLSHIARSSSKACLCKLDTTRHKSHQKQLKHWFKKACWHLAVLHTEEIDDDRCALFQLYFVKTFEKHFFNNHLMAQSYGCFSKILSLPLKYLSLLLQGLPILSEALFFLQHVAVAQQGRCLFITRRA